MQIREFAERILFGTSFEDKLTSPTGLLDDRRGPAIQVPRLPGRPEPLRLDVRRPKVRFPGTHELDRPGVRGRVLHFFANHELLATELMALCLLRFPDAPESFRRGLVQTIAEEQEHLQLYRRRMEEAGVALGEIPVNAFFWDCLSGMDDPIEFVAGMSLTFEQANLDYSRFYADAFREAGDVETADVLEKVYLDEIGHVKHGVVWFDRWRSPEEDAFDAYSKLLREPLTPARARGLIFDREGRRLAGLSDAFIERVEVHGAPKGRPPSIWLANLSCEHLWTHGDHHPLGLRASRVEQDLATLPVLLAAQDDLIALRDPPTSDYLAPLVRAGFPAPGFVELPDAQRPIKVSQRHLGTFRPWGWSPDALRRFAPLTERLSVHMPPVAALTKVATQVNRKSWSAALLREFLEAAEDRRLSPPASAGVACEGPEEAYRVMRAMLNDGSALIAKRDTGTSGRGQLRIRTLQELESSRGWLANAFRHHRALVVEPLLDVAANYSLVGSVEEDGPFRAEGVTRFLTDRRGQYLGAVLGQPNEGLSPEILRFRHGEGRDPHFLRRTLEASAALVARRLQKLGYVGPMGVDAFVYREPDGFRLRPLVEANVRFTMGHVAAALHPRLAGGVSALWLLIRREDLQDPERFVEDLRELAPLALHRRRRAVQITAGALFTTDPAQATQVYSLLIASDSLRSCLTSLHRAGLKEGALAALRSAITSPDELA